MKQIGSAKNKGICENKGSTKRQNREDGQGQRPTNPERETATWSDMRSIQQ